MLLLVLDLRRRGVRCLSCVRLERLDVVEAVEHFCRQL